MAKEKIEKAIYELENKLLQPVIRNAPYER